MYCYELKEITWDCDTAKREDTKLAQYAKDLGYTLMTAGEFDPKYANVPQTCIAFHNKAKNRNIWFCRLGWRCADEVDNRYCNHRTYADLKTALDTEA